MPEIAGLLCFYNERVTLHVARRTFVGCRRHADAPHRPPHDVTVVARDVRRGARRRDRPAASRASRSSSRPALRRDRGRRARGRRLSPRDARQPRLHLGRAQALLRPDLLPVPRGDDRPPVRRLRARQQRHDRRGARRSRRSRPACSGSSRRRRSRWSASRAATTSTRVGSSVPRSRQRSRCEGESMSSAPVIIEAAINGATSKERNPTCPRSPEEIADDPRVDRRRRRDHPQPHRPAWHVGRRGGGALPRGMAPRARGAARRADLPDGELRDGGHNYDHIAPLAASGLCAWGCSTRAR